jgi:hypothetical protein
MSLKLNELKQLHDLGFSLIYLHPREKRPIGNAWTTGPRKTWNELKAEFDPSYNVGVRLGETSKLENGYLACIDVDVKDPKYKKEALTKLKGVVNGNGIQGAPVVLSGSGNGSRHIYVVSREPFKMVEIEKHKDKWEICAYSTGRQMVLPPSIHPNGEAYCWGGDKGSFPKLNEKLLKSHRESTAVTRDAESTGRFKAVDVDLYSSKLDVATIKKITDGEGVQDRSAELLSIAMKMCRAKFTDNEILSVLSDENNWIADAAFEHTQSRDRSRAVKWLHKYTLLKARHETHPLRMFENQPDYSHLPRLTPKKTKKIIKEEVSIQFPDIDGNSKPKTTLRNVIHGLEHKVDKGIVGYNEFTNRPYFLKDTVYGGQKDRELAGTDDLALKHYLACHHRFEPAKETCFEAHTLLAQQYKFHPVKAYLESLEWDGVPRLDHWLFDAFRAEGPEDYIKAVGRKILCAAVARIYEPGCKFDYMTVFEGNQGEGKSMGLRELTGAQWFADSLGDIHNKDVVDQMMGKWIIEVGELDSIRGREAEAVKAFISRQVDRVRLSYERRAQDYPRQCIFIGSTNDQEYLTDETGNRRYWPIRVGLARREWLKANRDQLWAEAKYRYELGEKLYLSKDLELVARGEQEKRFEVDVWEVEVKKIIKDDEPGAIHTTTDLWRAVNLTNAVGHPPMNEAKRIGKIMRRLRYRRSTLRIDGVLSKCWVKQ